MHPFISQYTLWVKLFSVGRCFVLFLFVVLKSRNEKEMSTANFSFYNTGQTVIIVELSVNNVASTEAASCSCLSIRCSSTFYVIHIRYVMQDVDRECCDF